MNRLYSHMGHVIADCLRVGAMIVELYILVVLLYLLRHLLFFQLAIKSEYIIPYNVLCAGLIISLSIRNILVCSQSSIHNICTFVNKRDYILSWLLLAGLAVIDILLRPCFDIRYSLGENFVITIGTLLSLIGLAYFFTLTGAVFLSTLFFGVFPAKINGRTLFVSRRNICGYIKLVLFLFALSVFILGALTVTYNGDYFLFLLMIFCIYIVLSLKAGVNNKKIAPITIGKKRK